MSLLNRRVLLGCANGKNRVNCIIFPVPLSIWMFLYCFSLSIFSLFDIDRSEQLLRAVINGLNLGKEISM